MSAAVTARRMATRKTSPRPDGAVGLALAGTSVVWTLRESAPIPFDYLIGAAARPSAADQKERRFQEVAHTKRGSGLWLGGIAGDNATLVYAVTSVDYEDEAGCLAGTAPCTLKVEGGGVYRVVGRQLPELVGGTGPAVAVAASGGTVAYISTSTVGKDGRPEPDLQIVVVDRHLLAVGDRRRDLDPREARVAAVGRVERRQPHEPVHAALGRE